MHMHTILPNPYHLLMIFLLPPGWAVYMCINAYAYVYTFVGHMHIHPPTNAHMHTHPPTNMHTKYIHTVHTNLHAYKQHVHKILLGYMHTYTCVFMCVCVCVCVNALVRTLVRVYQVRMVTITISAEA